MGKSMRKLVATEYVTLDGYIDEPGLWSMPFFDDDMAKIKQDELFAADAQLLGRKTYEGFAAAWPAMSDEAGFADKMNSMPKYVATTTRDELEWNATPIKGDVADAVAKLKEEAGGDLLLAGSGQLFRMLMDNDLIDVYRFLIHPIVLGSGELQLFGDGLDKTTLKLVDTTTTGTGIVGVTYERAG
jgi:dihydrofolate reductase